MNTTALDHAALKTGSECSFTARKLRFFAGFRLACSSLVTCSWHLSKGLIAAALLGLALTGVAKAAIDTYQFKDEAERERFRVLTEELRCPKCQNQNIADSNAPIATDLRREIFRMLEEGRSNDEIVDYLVARYGDFVRYKPPINTRTLLLWYGPAGLLVGGLVVLGIIVVRRRRVENSPAQVLLSADEQARLDALLNSENQDKKDS